MRGWRILRIPGFDSLKPGGCVILFGAGISLAEPANLPSPDDLIGGAYLSLVRQLSARLGDALDELRSDEVVAAIRRLRLELGLEYVARELGASVAASAYECLTTARPNKNHYLLAGLADLGFSLATTNQDVLVEAAAEELGHSIREPMHLHGRVDRPMTIRTTLTQLREGLPRKPRGMFGELIEGRALLVVGYSGRDPDVLSVVRHFPPSRIFWLSHKGSVYREVERLHHDLWVGDLTATLAQVVQQANRRPPPRPAMKRRTTDRAEIRLRVPDSMSSSKVAIAISRLLDPTGFARLTMRLLDRVPAKRGEGAMLHLARGRALLKLERAEEATAEFARSRSLSLQAKDTRGVRDAINWQANAVRIRGDVRWMERLVGQLEEMGPAGPDRDNKEALAWALTHRAGAYRLSGRFRDAARDYSAARRLFASAASASGLVHCSTWSAENYRGQGRFDLAGKMSARAVELAEDFDAPDVRAWPLWNLGEVRKLQGRWDDALAHYRRARELFSEAGNTGAVDWCLSSIADALRSTDARAARDINFEAMRSAKGAFSLSACWLNEGEYLRLNSQFADAIVAFRLGGSIPGEEALAGNAGRIGLQSRLAILECMRLCGKPLLADYERIEQLAKVNGSEWLGMRTRIGRFFAVWQKDGKAPHRLKAQLVRELSKGRFPLELRIFDEGLAEGPSAPLPLVFN